MKNHIIWLLTMLPLLCLGQTITQGEYFFNGDEGTTMPILFSSSEEVNLDWDISFPASLPEGFNTVYFRFRDEDGDWSLLYPRLFFKNAVEYPENLPITYLEYFVDDDPGYGQAHSVGFQPGASVTFEFDVDELANLEPGFHRLYIRAKNETGIWSILSQRVFFLKEKEDPTLTNITGIEYYFKNQNSTSNMLTWLVDPPQPSVTLDSLADISSLEPDQIYDMYIYAINEDGVKSFIEKREFRACSTEPPTANFGYIGFGNTISLIDSSRFATSYHWDFGDGQTDTISNPVHQYTESGEYTVSLVASSFCKTDTITKQIHVANLTGISIESGGNYGDVSLDVYGGGFDGSSSFRLSRQGSFIFPDTTIIVSENVAHLRFDLRGESIGKYDVVLTQGPTQDVLAAAFTIVGQADEPRFSLDITGRTAIRAGRSEPLTFSFTNNSPTDAIAIPLFILIKGDTTVKIDFDFELIEPGENDGINYGSILPYFAVDSLYGEAQPAVIVPLMIPYLLAHQTEDLTIFIEASEDLVVEAWLGDNFYNSPLDNQLVSCVEGLFGLATSLIPTNPVTSCVTSVIDGGFSIYRQSYEETEGVFDTTRKYGSMLWSFAKAAEGCADLAGLVVPFIKVAKVAVIALTAIKAGSLTGDIYNIVVNCTGFFFGNHDTQVEQPIEVVNSFDPNEKSGPSNATAFNYTRSNHLFNYRIYFENVDSATAAAQEVWITDTLDTERLDLSTFTLGEMAFGETQRIFPPSGLQEYSKLVDLRPGTNLIVRVDAQLDTAKGIVNWRFFSLDPITMELTDDPFLGFLPPNVQSPEGEGFVSFAIQPKAGIATGTVVANRASIVFDINDPIITNTHHNTIDDIDPVSSVTDLEMVQNDTVFTVSWGGTDDDAGIRAYDIYVSVNNDTFQLWHYDMVATQADFIGRPDSTYGFYSIAKDFAGNREVGKTEAEASTFITFTSTDNHFGSLDPDDVLIFPNPSDCCFTIFADLANKEEYQLTLYNAIGQSLLHLSVRHWPFRLDLSGYPKGLYFLQIDNRNGRTVKQLILQ